MPQIETSPAPIIALACAEPRMTARADAFRAAWPDGPATDLTNAGRIWSKTRVAPDALLLFAGDTPDAETVARMERLRETVRAAGVDVPLIVETRKGADLDLARPANAYVSPHVSGGTLAARVRETIRQAVRMEEARLRRAALGALPVDPGATRRDPAGLMVAGAGQAAANALERAGVSLPIEGALSADAVCRRLTQTPHRALFIDMPVERTCDILQRVGADPRLVSLPVLAMAATADEVESLSAAGCGDVVLRDCDPADLGIRLRTLLLAGARRQLSDTLLRRFRSLYLEDGAHLPAAAFDAYLARLTQMMKARGRAPLVRTLGDLHPSPLPARADNDDPLAPVVGDPVRSTILAASREEDFVARVAGRGDMIVLRDAQALDGLSRRVGAIIATTSFV
jgi:DNA-binding NarL/FixJ family response regulator